MADTTLESKLNGITWAAVIASAIFMGWWHEMAWWEGLVFFVLAFLLNVWGYVTKQILVESESS